MARNDSRIASPKRQEPRKSESERKFFFWEKGRTSWPTNLVSPSASLLTVYHFGTLFNNFRASKLTKIELSNLNLFRSKWLFNQNWATSNVESWTSFGVSDCSIVSFACHSKTVLNRSKSLMIPFYLSKSVNISPLYKILVLDYTLLFIYYLHLQGYIFIDGFDLFEHNSVNTIPHNRY